MTNNPQYKNGDRVVIKGCLHDGDIGTISAEPVKSPRSKWLYRVQFREDYAWFGQDHISRVEEKKDAKL